MKSKLSCILIWHDTDGTPTVNSYESAATPPGSDDEAPAFGQSTAVEDHDDADTTQEEAPPKRKPGGYTSRVEQILYENPTMQIIITDAGKSLESGGRHIVYTIRTGVCTRKHSHEWYTNLVQDLEVRRRYSEFASLRDALTRLHPTLVIPPIPEKHTMADYAAHPTSAKQDQQIIDLRKRMLAVFLNRCRRMESVRNDGVWLRFLDPNASWVCLLKSAIHQF